MFLHKPRTHAVSISFFLKKKNNPTFCVKTTKSFLFCILHFLGCRRRRCLRFISVFFPHLLFMLKSHCSFFPLLLFKRRLPANDGRRKKEEEGKKAGTLRIVGRRRGKRGLLPLLPIISEEEEEEEGGEEGVYGSVCVCRTF